MATVSMRGIDEFFNTIRKRCIHKFAQYHSKVQPEHSLIDGDELEERSVSTVQKAFRGHSEDHFDRELEIEEKG
jgi:hypothetical protein